MLPYDVPCYFLLLTLFTYWCLLVLLKFGGERPMGPCEYAEEFPACRFTRSFAASANVGSAECRYALVEIHFCARTVSRTWYRRRPYTKVTRGYSDSVSHTYSAWFPANYDAQGVLKA